MIRRPRRTPGSSTGYPRRDGATDGDQRAGVCEQSRTTWARGSRECRSPTDQRPHENISLIAKGTIDGERRSLLYRPSTTNYDPDKTGVGPFTRAELVAKILAGDKLTFIRVPTASAQRMALDRDLNGVPDGDESPPLVTTVRSGADIVVSWTPSAVGVVLEVSEDLSADSWQISPVFKVRSGTVWKLPFRRQIGDGFTGCAICDG